MDLTERIGEREPSYARTERGEARRSEEADTFFTIPARVKVKGKSVSGFISAVSPSSMFYDFLRDRGLSHEEAWKESESYPERDLIFTAYKGRVNGDLLPAWDKTDGYLILGRREREKKETR